MGERMDKAFQVALGLHAKAIIIGSDCASLTPTIIENAFELLDVYDYVIGPASDGGYYLLAMKEPRPELFQGISWSTDQVLSQTIERIKKRGQSYSLLPELSDIDRAEDWAKYGWKVD